MKKKRKWLKQTLAKSFWPASLAATCTVEMRFANSVWGVRSRRLISPSFLFSPLRGDEVGDSPPVIANTNRDRIVGFVASKSNRRITEPSPSIHPKLLHLFHSKRGEDTEDMSSSCCDIQYTAPEVQEEAVAGEQQSNRTAASNVPASAYSWEYSFRAQVTETNVQEDKLALPVEATGCKALNKHCREATSTLVNIDGKPWTVALRFSESGSFYYIKGWRRFCRDNKCRVGDLFAINVVGDGMSSPLLCVYAPTKEILEILSTWKRKIHVRDIASSRMHRRLL